MSASQHPLKVDLVCAITARHENADHDLLRIFMFMRHARCFYNMVGGNLRVILRVKDVVSLYLEQLEKGNVAR